MTRTLDVADVRAFVVAYAAVLLAITGVLHLVRPVHLAEAAAQHRAAGVLPGWVTRFEQPVTVGASEVALAALLVVAAVAGGSAFVVVGGAVWAWSVLLLAVLARLRRAPGVSCGCHPFAGDVVYATSAPAVAMFVAATVALAVTPFVASRTPAPMHVLVMSALAALCACATIVGSGAASSTTRVPREG
jgi:hypothetical protein